MDHMNYKEALEMLRKAGLKASEIDQLCRLRRDFAQNEMDQAPVDHRRLEFVRWLVATGKLTDQIT
jgi:hypothetical protein